MSFRRIRMCERSELHSQRINAVCESVKYVSDSQIVLSVCMPRWTDSEGGRPKTAAAPTIGRRRGPRSGKAKNGTALAGPGEPPPGIGPEKPPKERKQRRHVFWRRC